MLRRLLPAALIAPAFALGGCVTAIPPVDVTRFHTPALARLAPGASYGFADTGGGGSELASYRVAVNQEMRRMGFVAAEAGVAPLLMVRAALTRRERAASATSPVSIGVGGGTGGYGSGLGVGIGFNLGGGPRRWVDLTLSVRIDDAATQTALWEGRAQSAVPMGAPEAQPSLAAAKLAKAAAKLAKALFLGFPGESGKTISVP